MAFFIYSFNHSEISDSHLQYQLRIFINYLNCSVAKNREREKRKIQLTSLLSTSQFDVKSTPNALHSLFEHVTLFFLFPIFCLVGKKEKQSKLVLN